MSEHVVIRELQLGGLEPTETRVNLADFGFRYHVSDAALKEIRQQERRANRVLTTAHLYYFR